MKKFLSVFSVVKLVIKICFLSNFLIQNSKNHEILNFKLNLKFTANHRRKNIQGAISKRNSLR